MHLLDIQNNRLKEKKSKDSREMRRNKKICLHLSCNSDKSRQNIRKQKCGKKI